jgi:hypothetical protein
LRFQGAAVDPQPTCVRTNPPGTRWGLKSIMNNNKKNKKKKKGKKERKRKRELIKASKHKRKVKGTVPCNGWVKRYFFTSTIKPVDRIFQISEAAIVFGLHECEGSG